MKRIVSIVGIGALLILIVFGAGNVLARGMSCHSGSGGGMMDQAESRSAHHSRMMGWMHQMHGAMSNWWNGSSADREATENASSENAEPNNSNQKSVEEESAETQITIRTKFSNGLAYEGASDGIDGTVNPTVRVKKGQDVKITLVNSMGGNHDLAIPALDVGSKVLTRRGASTTFEFVSEKTGTFSYYCTVRGHRSAGMEGKIIVKQEGE